MSTRGLVFGGAGRPLEIEDLRARRAAGRRGARPDGGLGRVPLGPPRRGWRVGAAGERRARPRGSRHRRGARAGRASRLAPGGRPRRPGLDGAVRQLRCLPTSRALALHPAPRQRASAPARRRPAAPEGRDAHRCLLRDRHLRRAPGGRARGRHPDRSEHATRARRAHRLRGDDRLRRGGQHGRRPGGGERGRHRCRRRRAVGRHGSALRRCRPDRGHRHQPREARAGTTRRRHPRIPAIGGRCQSAT